MNRRLQDFRFGLFALLFLTALAAAACHGAPRPSPPVVLPTLERPVLKLAAPDASHLLIPRALIVEQGGVPGVYVLSPSGQARFRMVLRGRTEGDEVQIISGLLGDETLVAGDLGEVHDGSPIRVQQP